MSPRTGRAPKGQESSARLKVEVGQLPMDPSSHEQSRGLMHSNIRESPSIKGTPGASRIESLGPVRLGSWLVSESVGRAWA